MFDPPEGQAAYSYVFDLTGEVRHDRPDMVSGLLPSLRLESLQCPGCKRYEAICLRSCASGFGPAAASADVAYVLSLTISYFFAASCVYAFIAYCFIACSRI